MDHEQAPVSALQNLHMPRQDHSRRMKGLGVGQDSLLRECAGFDRSIAMPLCLMTIFLFTDDATLLHHTFQTMQNPDMGQSTTPADLLTQS